MLKDIPQSIIVLIVLIGGVLSFFVLQKPHSVCDSQFEVLRGNLAGKLFPTSLKVGRRTALVDRAVQNCKLNLTVGSCFEAFQAFRSINKELTNIPAECGIEMDQVPEVARSLQAATELFVKLAWGDFPPEKTAKFGILESSDVAIFCGVKEQWLRLFGNESWEELRGKLSAGLPGEKAIIEKGVCVNCEGRKKAQDTLSYEDLWARSLFSVKCENYR